MCCFATLRVLDAAPAAPKLEASRFPAYRLAAQALSDGLPEGALPGLRRLAADSSVKGAARTQVHVLLAEALVRAGQAAEGLTVLQSLASKEPVALYWKGAALTDTGRLLEGEAVLKSMPVGTWQEHAMLVRASIFASLDQVPQALDLLRSLANSKDAELASRAQLAAASYCLDSGRVADAAAIVGSFQAPALRQQPAAKYLQASLALAQNKPDVATPLFATLEEGGRGISTQLMSAYAQTNCCLPMLMSAYAQTN